LSYFVLDEGGTRRNCKKRHRFKLNFLAPRLRSGKSKVDNLGNARQNEYKVDMKSAAKEWKLYGNGKSWEAAWNGYQGRVLGARVSHNRELALFQAARKPGFFEVENSWVCVLSLFH
jgi:hypothetical protein